jgi:peroxiredoxin
MRQWILSLAAFALVASPAFAGGVKVGDKAPSFDGIPAILQDGQDASLSLGDVKEDVVVVVFLANHCPAVVATEDRFIDLANSYKGKSVKVIGLSVTAAPGQKEIDDLAAIKKKVKEKGYNFAYGYDESQKIGKAYGAVVTPHCFVLDKERVVRYIGAPDNNVFDEKSVTKTYLKDAIDALLAGKDVPTESTKAVGCGIHYLNGK